MIQEGLGTRFMSVAPHLKHRSLSLRRALGVQTGFEIVVAVLESQGWDRWNSELLPGH
jgi:hypothetical protein